jgi:hypothetical protein
MFACGVVALTQHPEWFGVWQQPRYAVAGAAFRIGTESATLQPLAMPSPDLRGNVPEPMPSHGHVLLGQSSSAAG